MGSSKLKILDIGHANLSIEDAQSLLETSISKTSFEGNIRVIKVITGHGTGKLRELIRQWCTDQEGRFQAVIYGEDYNMFNKNASDMRADCGISRDSDFGRNNSAVTYIWLW